MGIDSRIDDIDILWVTAGLGCDGDIRACVQNCSELAAVQPREAERVSSLHGVHLLLHVEGPAYFSSLTEPPSAAEPYAALCEGQGLWCTVLGDDRTRPDTALVAPVILPDFPQVAPASVADLGDATEIDEMLSLRIRTLSPAEKQEARETDPWVRQMPDGVEALGPEQLLGLHGARRWPNEASAGPAHALRGARVRLTPRRSADGMDILLAGRIATVHQIEQSVDGELLLGVTLDDDPGRDLGEQGLPGHRFAPSSASCVLSPEVEAAACVCVEWLGRMIEQPDTDLVSLCAT
jgi:hypothetical protein